MQPPAFIKNRDAPWAIRNYKKRGRLQAAPTSNAFRKIVCAVLLRIRLTCRDKNLWLQLLAGFGIIEKRAAAKRLAKDLG